MIAAALLACAAGQSIAERDAAVKVQEGSVDHWIEYYKQQRGGESVRSENPAASQDAAATSPKPKGEAENASPGKGAPTR